MIFNFLFGGSKEKPLPPLSNPGVEADLRKGKQLINGDRKVINGSMPNVALAEPTITVNKSGQITATVTQNSDGYISSGTRNATKKLSSSDDPNFIASNINSRVSIFGLTGTAKIRKDSIVTIHNKTDNSLFVYYVDAKGTIHEDVEILEGDSLRNIEILDDSLLVLEIHTDVHWSIEYDGNVTVLMKSQSRDIGVIMVRTDADIKIFND